MVLKGSFYRLREKCKQFSGFGMAQCKIVGLFAFFEYGHEKSQAAHNVPHNELRMFNAFAVVQDATSGGIFLVIKNVEFLLSAVVWKFLDSFFPA